MKQSRPLDPFYKDAFCRAVTGHTCSELFQMLSDRCITPIDRKENLKIGRDMPRSDGEKLVDRYEIFMSSSFGVPLVEQSVEKLFEDFERFVAWERHIHPRDQGYSSHKDYWEPTYDKIERAYFEGNEDKIKRSIMELVDKILHD